MEVDAPEEDRDGSILSIRVRNFFCHDNLEINLNRNVNFIVGRNGSGKSAILTALVVGLGGRASATNRGTNLHSFIKKGANSATIEIKIKNSSEKAYKSSIYGDSITIVRNLNASGGSSYKVKSASGEIISTKHEEVNAIILAHDIQVDNPISVLNQDDARSFHASDSKKKYSLFRKATNMDVTEANYLRALHNCNRAIVIWKKKNEACVELEKEYKKWKTSHEQLQSRDEIEAQKKALQNEEYWSEISELEREISTIQNEYNKQTLKIEQLAEKMKRMAELFSSNNTMIEALKNQLEEKSMEKTAHQQVLLDLESEVRETQGSLRGVQQSTAKHKDQLHREQRKIVDLEREIRNIETGGAASQRLQYEQRAASAELAASSARARYDTAQNDATQARANSAHVHAQAEHATVAAQRQRDSLKQLRQQLRELESRSNDSLAVYGNNMVELCHEINKAVAKGEFSERPRGPIGAHLKVRDKRWAGPLEHIIGGSMQSFCVNTSEDSRKLFSIMNRVYGRAGKPSVTCSKFLPRQHDVRRNRVRAPGHHSALDALDVSDPVVANYLIDNISLETILLVPNHEDAVRLSDNEENVPENCSKIVTLDCTEYYPAPNYRSYGGAGRHSRYLQISTAERKRQVQSEIQEAETTLRKLEAEAEELSQRAKQARENERAASRTLQALLADRHTKDEEARVATAALDHHQAPHHAVLEEELNVSKDKVKNLQEQIDSLASKEQQYKLKIDDLETRMKAAKSKLAEVNSSYRNISEDIEQEQMKVDQSVTTRRGYQQRLDADRVKLSQVEIILADKNADLNAKIQKALTICPRIDNPGDRATVASELKKTQLKLSSIRNEGLTKEQVSERLKEVEVKYKRAKKTLTRLDNLIKEINDTTDKHLKFCYKVETYIARRVQYCFQSILTLRSYSGRMDIDNARGTLDIVCTGRESADKRLAATTSSLSGGERSYSTVAFIMALWECVELPFYFMDEFDVFMDNVNRKIVMELLIDYALRNTNRQFVFLTPQDASSITAGPKISIHLMADPRP